MSGGSWDYFYGNIENASDRLRRSECALRRAFGKHMKLVANAMHDIEWVDSYDYGPGDERKAIEKALGKNARVLEIEEAKAEARALIKELKRLAEDNGA